MLGCRQAVSSAILIRVFLGSNPSTPTIFSIRTVEKQIQKTRSILDLHALELYNLGSYVVQNGSIENDSNRFGYPVFR